jgi:carboxyl-terminal processing protease
MRNPRGLVRSLTVATLVLAGTLPFLSSRAAEVHKGPLPGAPEGEHLTCDELPRLMGTFLQNHVHYHSLTPELKERVADSHVRALDPSRSLLLESDAQQLRDATAGVFAALARQDCTLLESMHQMTIRKYRELQDFVREYVSRKDYAIDRSASLLLDPDKRGFPKTAEERDDLNRKLVHFQMSNYVASGMPLAEAKQKLIHRYELVTRRAEEMKQDEIYGRFLEAFASSLDPHSSYLSQDSLEDFKIHMGLSLEGIGAVLSSRDGYTVVEEVVPGGAADLAGTLKPKDKIIAVGQESGDMIDVIDMDLREVVRMIRGKKGSAVRLTVLRQGANTERVSMRLLRDKINLEEQAAKVRFVQVDSGGKSYKLAILDLPSFYGDKDPGTRQATDDVARLLAQVKAEKPDGLLLDLSRNGGGLLEYAVKITGFFLAKGGVVAVGDSQDHSQVLEDPDESIQYAGPLVVLTSRVTASAAEILAGAVKDYRRGLIVGDEHTFGKGSVQTVAPLPPGLGALKLTTALFFRPGGESTQQVGVPSDIVLPSLTDIDDLGETAQPYSLPAQSIHPFLGDGKPKARGFEPLPSDAVPLLAQRSRERVAADQKFAEVEKQLAKQRENEGAVKVADLLDKKPEAGGSPDGSPAAALGADAGVAPSKLPGAKEPDPPQLTEALRILADYVATSRHVALNP